MPILVPADLPERDAYFLLTSLVVPRPIAWVSTVSRDGVNNLAPHSFFNVISTDPPIVHFTSTRVKDSLTNVEATGEFVVNVVSRPLLEAMNLTSAEMPPEEDEFAWAGLETAPSELVAPPRVAAAPAALECRLRSVLRMGNGHMVFGDVVAVHVADRVWRDGRVDMAALEPVGRLSGAQYLLDGRVHRLPRPTWEQVLSQADGSRS